MNILDYMNFMQQPIIAAYKKTDGFLFKINKVQIIFLPYKVFNSDNEIKFVESVLRRKGYIK